MSLENIVANLVQKVERRFYGKYRGFVVDNADPELLGRLKVKVPSVLGNDVVTGWATPCAPYGGSADQGFLFIPDIDAGVWIEFEEGDLEFPIWVGTFWSKPGGESELPKPDDNVQAPPTQKIIKTKKGHTIQLEDADGEEKIIIKHKEKSFISIDKDGSVIIGNNKGSTIILNSKEENMVVVEQHGSSINMTEKGVMIVNSDGGAALELSGDMVRLVAKDIVLQGSSVVLGAGASGPTVIGQSFQDLWNAFALHVHASPGAPQTSAVPPAPSVIPGEHLTPGVLV